MAQKDARAIQAELARPFAPEDLEWRLQKAIEAQKRGIAVPFVTNRAIQNRLDDVVGPDCWYNDFKPWHTAGKKEAQICGISIYFEGKGFITKWDGAEDSDIEPIKGGLSDSMKRAAVQWGIGRILYNMEPVWVNIEQKGKSWYIQKSERVTLDKAYLSMLNALNLKPAPAGGIQSTLEGSGTEPVESPENPPQKAGTPAIPPKDGGAAQKGCQVPEKQEEQAPEPEYEFIVSTAQVQKGMKSKNTFVRLKSADGKEINAFAQGEHLTLVPGAMLTNTKLSTKQQDTVVYFILESYQIVPQDQQAA
nr:Rad52/Rad22 family DNA repair protein [uncultured Oscillibacter sp.]